MSRYSIETVGPECEGPLQVVETATRDAIKKGKRTIAYLAIGAEAWGPLLAAAPELRDALETTCDALTALLRDCMEQPDFPGVVASVITRDLMTARKLLERDL